MKYIKLFEWHKDFIDINKTYDDMVSKFKELEFILNDEHFIIEYFKHNSLMPDGILMTIDLTTNSRMNGIGNDLSTSVDKYLKWIPDQDFFVEYLNRIRGFAQEYEDFDVSVPLQGKSRGFKSPMTILIVKRSIYGRFYADSELEF